MFEIGTSLREARLRRRVDFALAEQATKIRGKYLRALEEEQFEMLPSQTYIKGFLRTYAEYLGLDGQLYVDEYNSRFVAGEEVDLRPRRSDVRPQRRNRRFETNIVLVALAAIAIVTVVLISAWKSSGGKPTTTTVARKPAVVPPVHRRAPLLAITAARGDSQLAVHQGGPSGRVRFEGTLRRGRTQNFDAARLWLNIASPENLVLKVRGRRVRLAGNRPRVIVVTRTGIHPA